MALTDKLTAIANAIRAKTGKTESLTLEQMPTEIESITTGGGSSDDVRYVTFRNEATGEEFVKPVATGDDCVDVVAKGLWAKPTKPSDAQYDYTYYGWGASDGGAADSTILQNITEDKTVYAIFTKTVRIYTITWLDDDGTTVLKTESLAYGAMPSYEPTKDNYTFKGWTPAITAVTGDASYTASWVVNGWQWDLADGVLTISGNSAIDDYTSLINPPWYSDADKITHIVIEDGVTGIGSYAFFKMSNVTSVKIAQTVTSIGNYAFGLCTGLKEITIPNSVTTLGSSVFTGCTGLTEITIPNSVTTIGTGLLYNCKGLTSANLPDNMGSIPGSMFTNCFALTGLTLPEQCTSIGSYSFSSCTALDSIEIPSGVTSIGKKAFDGCNALTSATFKTTSGWYVTQTEGATSGSNLTLTNTSTNATYLKTTYPNYYWYRK